MVISILNPGKLALCFGIQFYCFNGEHRQNPPSLLSVLFKFFFATNNISWIQQNRVIKIFKFWKYLNLQWFIICPIKTNISNFMIAKYVAILSVHVIGWIRCLRIYRKARIKTRGARITNALRGDREEFKRRLASELQA